MSTSSLVQLLSTEAEGASSVTSHRRVTETFLAGGTIVAGDWVMFDTSKTASDRVLYVVQAAATTSGPIIVGVALDAAVSGGRVRVVVSGYVEGVNVATATLIGQPLFISSTAGRALGSSLTLGYDATFLSAEITGNAAAQSTAHGLGIAPTVAFAIPSDHTGGAFAVVYGAHDATNVIATVTNNEKYRMVALRLGYSGLATANGAPIGVALENAAGNLCDVLVRPRF
tara:strand:+ start:1314 stop:1997 length:684 start_codon:yes stop_codon:yes gene_type:complete